MNKRDTERCSCDVAVFVIDGHRVEQPQRIDPDCRAHGLPYDEWPTGHPLYRHALIVERETGRLWNRQEAHEAVREADRLAVDYSAWTSRFREETPRETEARLVAESRSPTSTTDDCQQSSPKGSSDSSVGVAREEKT